MQYYGIRGKTLDWLSNYLLERAQFADFDGPYSKSANICYGVPQGSILGSLLYLIYVHDVHVATFGKILSFADDTSLFLSNSNLAILFHNANIEINKLYNWFCANKLSLNANKTKCMVSRSPYFECDFLNHRIAVNGTRFHELVKCVLKKCKQICCGSGWIYILETSYVPYQEQGI